MKFFAIAAAALASLTIAAPAHAGGEHFAAGVVAGSLCKMYVKGVSLPVAYDTAHNIMVSEGHDPNLLYRPDVVAAGERKAYEFCQLPYWLIRGA
jgi:hypothetical protein